MMENTLINSINIQVISTNLWKNWSSTNTSPHEFVWFHSIFKKFTELDRNHFVLIIHGYFQE